MVTLCSEPKGKNQGQRSNGSNRQTDNRVPPNLLFPFFMVDKENTTENAQKKWSFSNGHSLLLILGNGFPALPSNTSAANWIHELRENELHKK